MKQESPLRTLRQFTGRARTVRGANLASANLASPRGRVFVPKTMAYQRQRSASLSGAPGPVSWTVPSNRTTRVAFEVGGTLQVAQVYVMV